MNGEAYARLVEIYSDENGNAPFSDWLLSQERIIQIRVEERLRRVELGNLGDWQSLGQQLYEFRFNFGSGYRIYFTVINQQIILLLSAGDKSTQEKDIKKARSYLQNYLEQINEKIS